MKAAKIVGGILALVVLVGVIVVSKAVGLDKESQRYADEAIHAIVSNWDQTELEKRASPQFKAVVNAEKLNLLYKKYRTLGKLKAYHGAQGMANISVTPATGKVISARYSAKVDFETGPARIDLVTIKNGGQWQILGINVISDEFLK